MKREELDPVLKIIFFLVELAIVAFEEVLDKFLALTTISLSSESLVSLMT